MDKARGNPRGNATGKTRSKARGKKPGKMPGKRQGARGEARGKERGKARGNARGNIQEARCNKERSNARRPGKARKDARQGSYRQAKYPQTTQMINALFESYPYGTIVTHNTYPNPYPYPKVTFKAGSQCPGQGYSSHASKDSNLQGRSQCLCSPAAASRSGLARPHHQHWLQASLY